MSGPSRARAMQNFPCPTKPNFRTYCAISCTDGVNIGTHCVFFYLVSNFFINNILSEPSVGGAKQDVEKNVPARTESWPKGPILVSSEA